MTPTDGFLAQVSTKPWSAPQVISPEMSVGTSGRIAARPHGFASFDQAPCRRMLRQACCASSTLPPRGPRRRRFLDDDTGGAPGLA
jgi:hypothetical protein